MSDLPEPLVPPEIDLRDVPIPREFFATMLAAQFGMDQSTAAGLVDKAADHLENGALGSPEKDGGRR